MVSRNFFLHIYLFCQYVLILTLKSGKEGHWKNIFWCNIFFIKLFTYIPKYVGSVQIIYLQMPTYIVI